MKKATFLAATCALTVVLAVTSGALAIDFGPEQVIQAGGSDIVVGRFATAMFDDWNNDGLNDLIIGEGAAAIGKVRIYLNGGPAGAPVFNTFFYAQADGSDLEVSSTGCLPACPRTADWDNDGRKDLIVGLNDGRVQVYLNVNTDAAPSFDAGSLVQVGPAGSKVDLDVGSRAIVDLVDWNNDSLMDLVIGDMGSRIRIYLDEGAPGSPDFLGYSFAQDSGSDLFVPGGRSAPSVVDLDGDGKKDLLSGNTYGELYFYSNVGTDAAPNFSGWELATSEGTVIDIDLPWDDRVRSRPFVCDWNDDGLLDVLVGAGDGLEGKVFLYQGVPEPTTMALLAASGVALLRRRR